MMLPNYSSEGAENSPWQNPFQAYGQPPAGAAPGGAPTPGPGWTFDPSKGGWTNPASASHDPNNPSGVWAPTSPQALAGAGNVMLDAHGNPLGSGQTGASTGQLADIQMLMQQIQQQRQGQVGPPAAAGAGSPFGNPAYARQYPTGVNPTQTLFYAPSTKPLTSPANPAAKGAAPFNPAMAPKPQTHRGMANWGY